MFFYRERERESVQLESILKTRSLGGLRKNFPPSLGVLFLVFDISGKNVAPLNLHEPAKKITTQVGEKYGCTTVDG